MPYPPLPPELQDQLPSDSDFTPEADRPGLFTRFGEETLNIGTELERTAEQSLYDVGFSLPGEKRPNPPDWFNPPPAKTLPEKIAGGAATVAKIAPLFALGGAGGAALVEEVGATGTAANVIRSSAAFGAAGATESPEAIPREALIGAGFGVAEKPLAQAAKWLWGLLKGEGEGIAKTAEKAVEPTAATPAAAEPQVATLQPEVPPQPASPATPPINTSRQLKLSSVMHSDDDEMVLKAADKLGIFYDGTMGDTGQRILNFSHPTGPSFALQEGATYKDLKNKLSSTLENFGREPSEGELATLQRIQERKQQAATPPVPESPLSSLEKSDTSSTFAPGNKVLAKLPGADEPEIVVVKASGGGVNTVQSISDGLVFDSIPDKHLKSLGEVDIGKILRGEPLTGDVFGFGPGAAAAGETLATEFHADQLSKILSARGGSAETAEGLTESLGKAREIIGDLKNRSLNALAIMRATGKEFGKLFTGVTKFDDYLDIKGQWQARHQFAAMESKSLLTETTKSFSPLEREAMNNFAEATRQSAATGKPVDEVLQEWAAGSKNPKVAAAYHKARSLDETQIATANQFKQFYESAAQDAEKAGVLKHFIEEYAGPHLVSQETAGELNGLRADLVSGKLNRNFKFALQRLNDSEFALEQKGKKLLTKDIGEKAAAYNYTLKKVIADRRWVRDMMEKSTADGEPWLVPSGIGRTVGEGEENPAAVLVKPNSGVPKNDYVKVDHPALRSWKWVQTTGDGTRVILEGDLWAHRSIAEDLKNTLGRSKLYDIPGIDLLTKANAEAKGLKLVGIFHQVQTATHALGHLTKPWSMPAIDIANPLHRAAIEGGLQVANFHEQQIFSEGLTSGNLLTKILDIASSPIPKAEVGTRVKQYSEYLFSDYIPRLKMSTLENVFNRNMQRYGPAEYRTGARGKFGDVLRDIPYVRALRPDLSPKDIMVLSANQTNYAFGELNWKLMGTNPTFQHALRLALMAPDFQAARGGTVAQAFTQLGAEQRQTIGVLAAMTYTVPRILNTLISGNPRFDVPFGVVFNNKEYSMRSIPSDAVRGLNNTTQFIYHRLAPWASGTIELLTGHDYCGIKVTMGERALDIGKQFIPIPLTPSKDLKWYEQLFNGLGMVVSRAPTTVTQVMNMASDFRKSSTDPKVQAEVKRAQQETYAESDYRALNMALADGDESAIKKAIATLQSDKGKSWGDMAEYYGNLPAKPFTGSQAMESKFLKQMKPEDRQQYNQAVQERRMLSQGFFHYLKQFRSSQGATSPTR